MSIGPNLLRERYLGRGFYCWNGRVDARNTLFIRASCIDITLSRHNKGNDPEWCDKSCDVIGAWQHKLHRVCYPCNNLGGVTNLPKVMQPRTPHLAILREGKHIATVRKEVRIGTHNALVSRNIKLFKRESISGRANTELAKTIEPCRAWPPKLIDDGKECTTLCKATASCIAKRDTIEQCTEACLSCQAIFVALPHCAICRPNKLRSAHCRDTLNTPFAALWLTHFKGRAHIAILLNILRAPSHHCAFAIGIGSQLRTIRPLGKVVIKLKAFTGKNNATFCCLTG